MSRQSKQRNKAKARAAMISGGKGPSSTTPKHGKRHRMVPRPKDGAVLKNHADSGAGNWAMWQRAMKEEKRTIRKMRANEGV